MSILCGTGRRIINPEIGHHIIGYGDDYLSTGIHDDITVTAVYLHDGEQVAVLLNYDLLLLVRETSGRIRTAVAAALGITIKQVFIACTHTHSGPDVYELPGRTHCRQDYLDRLTQWSVESAVAARASAEACHLRYNSVSAIGNMNRRFNFMDRRTVYTPDNKQLIGLSSEYVDPELGILAFRRVGTENSYKAVITNFTCHPVCVGNSSNLISADYQGYLRRTVEETFAGCHCLAMTGAAGDNHPLNPESGFSGAAELGERLGRLAIMRAYDSVAVDDTRLRMAYTEIALPRRDQVTADMMPEASARAQPLSPDRSPIVTDISLLGIGPFLLAGFPGEPVAELGARLKWSSPFLKCYALFTATDYLGYLPTVNQFRWGGYETNTSHFACDAGDRVVDAMLNQAHRLLREQPLNVPALAVAGVTGRPSV